MDTYKILRVDKFNEMQTKKWSEDYDRIFKDEDVPLPQLAFYLIRSEVHYGFVAYNKRSVRWFRFKREAKAFAGKENTLSIQVS